MNFTFHWFRRDIRRHGLFIALWALLVASFTWARLWFRMHPEYLIGDRDLWLSVPAAGLGFAETCLLLRVLLDDPARGVTAFWKTRPPSAGSVVTAKLGTMVLTALVIPLAGEAVFLFMAGVSSGGPERFSLYLLPPLLALTAGTIATQWRLVLLWLPLAVVVPGALLALRAWLHARHPFIAADHRLSMAAALTVSAVIAAVSYYRRKPGAAFAAFPLVLPGAAAAAVAATGWLSDSRLTTPPPGRDPEQFVVSWHQKPLIVPDYRGGACTLKVPLSIAGLSPDEFVTGDLASVIIKPDGHPAERQDVMGSRSRLHPSPGAVMAAWDVRLSDAMADALKEVEFIVSGTVSLRIHDRKRHHLPLAGTHTVEAGNSRWRLTPVAGPNVRFPQFYVRSNDSSLHYQFEYVNRGLFDERSLEFIDPDTAALGRKSDGLSLPLYSFRIYPEALLWEGAGRDVRPLEFQMSARGIGETAPAIREELKDPRRQDAWELEFDTLALSGTLNLPFVLLSPGPVSQ